jgi:hypothetical protein
MERDLKKIARRFLITVLSIISIVLLNAYFNYYFDAVLNKEDGQVALHPGKDQSFSGILNVHDRFEPLSIHRKPEDDSFGLNQYRYPDFLRKAGRVPKNIDREN